MSHTSTALKKLLLASVLSATVVPWASAQEFTPPVAAKPAGGPAKNANYVIDPTHTFVMYEMGHYGTTTNRGRFSTKDGSVQIDGTGASGKVDILSLIHI